MEPIVAILLGVRQKMNETNKRTEIILAAIEKNPEMDVEELMEKISPKKKLLKEKILSKLQVGMIATLLGIGFIGGEMYLSIFKNSSSPMGVVGLILLPVGIAFLVSYFTGKKEALRGFLLALCCGNKSDADDLAQDALVKAYLSSAGYQEKGKFRAWIFKIAYNTFLNHKASFRTTESIDEARMLASSNSLLSQWL